MTSDPLAAGDLIAERRFAYAKAAAEEGDLGAAAEMFAQALAQAPHWAAAAFALGETRQKLGDLDAAADAFRASLAADPADAQGAAARLALIGRERRPLPCRKPMSRACSTIMRRASSGISLTISATAAPPSSPRRSAWRRRAADSPTRSTSAAARASWARLCAVRSIT